MLLAYEQTQISTCTSPRPLEADHICSIVRCLTKGAQPKLSVLVKASCSRCTSLLSLLTSPESSLFIPRQMFLSCQPVLDCSVDMLTTCFGPCKAGTLKNFVFQNKIKVIMSKVKTLLDFLTFCSLVIYF